MAIDKHCYIGTGFLPPFFGIRHRIIWSHIEAVGAIFEIPPPCRAGRPADLGFDDTQGIELFHQGDLPARSGIGSSSAFAVGLINVLNAMRGESLDAMPSPRSDGPRAEQAQGKRRMPGPDRQRLWRHQRHQVRADDSFSVTPLGLSDAGAAT